MQNFNLSRHHKHQFDQGNPLAQKRILWATLLTGFMMLLEISGGWLFNSMALLADGWHMSSHMLALGLAYLAYRARATMQMTSVSVLEPGKSKFWQATVAPFY